MILLDTDHLSILKYEDSARCLRLQVQMSSTPGQSFATTIVNAEEQMRGWLERVHSQHDVHKQIVQYGRLAQLFEFYKDWQLVPFELRAADEFKRLKEQKVRIGTMDLKIASIALTQGALLLSANLCDFRQVPGLRFESWID